MQTTTVELPARVVAQLKAATGKRSARAAILEIAREHEYTLRNGDKVFADAAATGRYLDAKFKRK
ncbi:MAG: hypothetical protein QM741_15535 [Rudaea sp.]|uniref:hypothetical protein n=1 Tax=Rudaea sp. TaxID=2136325 RepID=UPI0039E5BE34